MRDHILWPMEQSFKTGSTAIVSITNTHDIVPSFLSHLYFELFLWLYGLKGDLYITVHTVHVYLHEVHRKPLQYQPWGHWLQCLSSSLQVQQCSISVTNLHKVNPLYAVYII